MADFITPIIDILTRSCGYCSKWADSIRQLGDNLDSLRNALNQLNARYLDVQMKVETAEMNPEQTILNEVRDWMGREQVLQNEVHAILQQGDQQIQAKCFGGRCPKNCRASYKLQKKVIQKLSDVNDVISKGNFNVVAEKHSRYRFDELPVDKAVGVESTFKELCSCFEDKQVGIIGLYGMGGVGKTTLLKKFNNDFLSTIPHYAVIWVVASKDADPGKIQDDIKKKLRVEEDDWNNKNMDQRAILLCNILKEKKFVMLLDDVWERIDLVNLGVPSPDNHQCKIIFTTRSKEVCGQMGAQGRISVNCLSPDKAFELFREKVGGTALDENTLIFDLAKQVVDECKGLPLALCTVGRTMANKVTANEWKRSIEILKSYPSKVKGIVENVYSLLEFSYDRLPDSCKSCFLYCALFPEDYDIPIDQLLLLWIAEGFLTEFDNDIHEARKQGEDIISNLKYSCLLENGEEEDTIKMHDVIRDMVLWVACDHGEKTKFVVIDCLVTSGLQKYNHAKWEEVEKLSMWRGDGMIMNLSQKPHCPNLVTLFLRDTMMQVFPTEVFVLPSTIRVLDLSGNYIMTNLPSLVGDFINLEYMNLSSTRIEKLPEELKKLKKLRFLLLDGLPYVEFLKEVISSLLSLQAFSMKWSFRANMNRFMYERVDDENGVLLQELEGLNHLQDIRITVQKESSVEKILKSSKLQGCMCELIVSEGSLHHDFFSSLGKMEHLETLVVSFVVMRTMNDDVVNIPKRSFWEHQHTISLRNLTLESCENIVDLNWLIYAPYLEVLQLVGCDSLEEVISEDFGTTADTERVKSNLFSSLTHLHLNSLNKLRSVCRMPLQFPCLKSIEVLYCPNLKKLPFNSQSALTNLQLFIGDGEWMDELQWEDEDTKHLLSSKFEEY